MSKFCGNCGTQLDDDARVCGNCGMPCISDNSVAYTPNVNISVAKSMAPEKKNKVKLIAGLSIAGIALIIIAIIAVNIISSLFGYNGVINKAMNAFEDYNTETLASMTNNFSYKSFDPDDIEDSISNAISYQYDKFEDKVGGNLKISHEIKKAEKLADRKYEKFLDFVEDTFHYDTNDISEVVSTKITVTAKGKEGKTTENVYDLYLIKEDGKWYLYYGIYY